MTRIVLAEFEHAGYRGRALWNAERGVYSGFVLDLLDRIEFE